MADSNRAHRLAEVDALRGLPALAVVLFHYTTRFTDLFGANPPPTISFPAGHYGANLFFIISGFVIPNTALRSAIESIATKDRRFRLGPDSDTLSSGTFRNGCHLTSDGLDSAAKLWAAAIIGQASTISPARFQ